MFHRSRRRRLHPSMTRRLRRPAWRSLRSPAGASCSSAVLRCVLDPWQWIELSSCRPLFGCTTSSCCATPCHATRKQSQRVIDVTRRLYGMVDNIVACCPADDRLLRGHHRRADHRQGRHRPASPRDQPAARRDQGMTSSFSMRWHVLPLPQDCAGAASMLTAETSCCIVIAGSLLRS